MAKSIRATTHQNLAGNQWRDVYVLENGIQTGVHPDNGQSALVLNTHTTEEPRNERTDIPAHWDNRFSRSVARRLVRAFERDNVLEMMTALAECAIDRLDGSICEPESDEDGAAAAPDFREEIEVAEYLVLRYSPGSTGPLESENEQRQTASNFAKDAHAFRLTATATVAILEAIEDAVRCLADTEKKSAGKNRCARIANKYVTRNMDAICKRQLLPLAEQERFGLEDCSFAINEMAAARRAKRYYDFCRLHDVAPDTRDFKNDSEFGVLAPEQLSRILRMAREEKTPLVNFREPTDAAQEADATKVALAVTPTAATPPDPKCDEPMMLILIPRIVEVMIRGWHLILENPTSNPADVARQFYSFTEGRLKMDIINQYRGVPLGQMKPIILPDRVNTAIREEVQKQLVAYYAAKNNAPAQEAVMKYIASLDAPN